MTASLPVPDEDRSDDVDGSTVRGPEPLARIARLIRRPPRKPRIPAAQAALQAEAAAAGQTEADADAIGDAVDPGPPPPLPPQVEEREIAIPPKPPLPPHEPPVATAEPETADAPRTDEADTAPPTPKPRKPRTTQSAPRKTPPRKPAAKSPVPKEPEVEEPSQPEAEESPQPEAGELPRAEPEAGELPQAEPEVEEPPEPPPAPAEVSTVVEAEVLTVPDAQAHVAALSLRGIRKSFGGTVAVDGIDLTVPAGTFYGLVGPNGAGKTTTLSMIAGLLRPDRGSVVVGGLDAVTHPIEAKRMMGVLPDRLRTFDRLTGRQLLYYSGVLRGLKPAVVESRTADLARAFDLTDALGRVVSDYSAGMAKKVMLAGAMIHSPRLLVLDEPFEAVDPVSSAVILEILSAYVSHGGTVILSSHGMELVERVCSRVAVLVAGQVLAEGTVDEVRGELTLEQRFIELAGGLSDVEGLEWLHTFSD